MYDYSTFWSTVLGALVILVPAALYYTSAFWWSKLFWRTQHWRENHAHVRFAPLYGALMVSGCLGLGLVGFVTLVYTTYRGIRLLVGM